MSHLDDRIRSALSGLKQAPVPPVPRIRPLMAEHRPAGPALLAAAAMLVVLAGTLYLIPGRGRAPEAAAVAVRISALEARIARIENDELRALMGHELALLRRELELSQRSE